LKPNPEFAHL